MNDDNFVVQQLHLLLRAYGYNLYNSNNRARADDLLVRQRVSVALGDAASHLSEVAADFAAHCIPPSTRDNPYPPAEKMAQLQAIKSLGDRVSVLGASVRGMSVPTRDDVWAKFRTENQTLNSLIQSDYNLITGADAVLKAVQDLAAETCSAGSLIEAQTLLHDLEVKAHDRERMLQAPI